MSISLSLAEQVRHDLTRGGALSASLPDYEERAAQVEMAELVAQALENSNHAVIEASTGTGKALDVDTPIPTPTGWKRMGNLVVGDLVFDETGHPTRVVAAFDMMYDRPCYEVEFSDGSTLVADAEHEWASYTSADRKWAGQPPRSAVYRVKKFVTSDKLAALDLLIATTQKDETLSKSEAVALIGGHHWSVLQATQKIPAVNPGKYYLHYPRRALLIAVRSRLERDLRGQSRMGRTYTLVTTEQMAATLTVNSTARANHAIAVAGALTLPEADLPISPYFLGVWLGDGSSRSNQITTADPDIILEIEKTGYTVRKLKSHPYLYAVDDEDGKALSRWQPGMTGRLRSLGLRLNKHIPTIYLRASERQRRALLAGLLDTDGTVSCHGAVEFTTTTRELAEDVYELLCSLGFRPYLRQGRARLNGKDCGPKWTLAFTTNQQVFQLPRKIAAHQERLRTYTAERNRFRYVVAVRPAPSRPVRCIQVEALSHLYLAGRAMIPTHNSLAYLLPIVRSGKVAIISTANKNLQEQLFYKDIPFVQQHIKDFRAALIKGMGNYLCLDRFDKENSELLPFQRSSAFEHLLRFLQDTVTGGAGAGDAFDGDLDTIPFTLPGDVRARVAADSDQCAWSKCNWFGECYVREMRQRAREAQIIVVNHTLLLLDAAMDGWLLPEREVVVIDEAHHLEEEATRAFTVTVSPGRVQSLLQQRRLRDHVDPLLFQEAGQRNVVAWDRLAQIADPGYKNRALLTQPFQEGLHLAHAIDSLAEDMKYRRPDNLDEKEEQLYDKLVKRARSLASDLRVAFTVEDLKRRVYYVEREGGPRRQNDGLRQLSVSAAPLSITELLHTQLFEKINIVATSATLAVGGDFSFFRRRVGALSKVVERVLLPTFDYPNRALLYLPRGLPEPTFGADNSAYIDALTREMAQLVRASRGRAFLLFSSHKTMMAVYEQIRDALDFTLLLQGDFSRIELIRRFRSTPNAVLLGLKSFWEGVDIAGEALSLVVIDKLPFDPPDDPVHEARVKQMKEANEDWFNGYVLPQATLRLKQGLGRLIRTREDRGVMAILDARLYTKYYGSRVVAALPPARKTMKIEDVEKFFAEEAAQ